MASGDFILSTADNGPASGFARVAVLGWWSAYLVLSPFYVFRSGNPQPADLLFVGALPFLLLVFPIRIPRYSDVLAAGVALVGYIAVVNLFYWAQHHDTRFAMAPAYYAYNFVLLLTILSLRFWLNDDVVRYTRLALLVTVALQLAIVLFFPERGWRQTGSFNNPNQLGYWCLLTAACLVVLKEERKLSAVDVGAFLVLTYLVAVSLSKAAMVSWVLLVIIALTGQGLSKRWILLGGSVLAVWLIAVTAMSPGTGSDRGRFQTASESKVESGIIANIEARFRHVRDGDSAAGRGYDRIWLNPEYLLLGAGEGAYRRLRSPGLPYASLHSTLGTVLFSYGIVGFTIFCLFLAGVFRGAPLRHAALLGPIFLYGLTHNGLRFSTTWVFFALVAAAARRPRFASERPVTSRRAAATPWPTAGLPGRARQ